MREFRFQSAVITVGPLLEDNLFLAMVLLSLIVLKDEPS